MHNGVASFTIDVLKVECNMKLYNACSTVCQPHLILVEVIFGKKKKEIQ
jgi:hypothetical protein